MPIITNATSVIQAASAFTGAGPDTLTIDPGAYLISTGSHGASLAGAWTVNVSGAIGSYAALGIVLSTAGAGLVSNISIASGGEVFGADEGIYALHAANITNRGAIASSTLAAISEHATAGDFNITNYGLVLGAAKAIELVGDGTHKIVNRGTISALINSIDATGALGNETIVNTGIVIGNVNLGDGNDTFIDLAKVGKAYKSGKVFGIVDLGDGNDIFKGGNLAEAVRDGGGADIVRLGGGKDTYLSISVTTDPDGVDTVDGGAGSDTFDLTGTAAGTAYYVNLDTVSRLTIPASTATTGIVGIPETILNFENVTGGASDDNIAGNKFANVLLGADGTDFIYGFGGNDTIDGGDGADFILGGAGNDLLTGGNGTDNLSGEAGNDTVDGGAGTDSVSGGAGNDVIIGGLGADALAGQEGRDVLTGGADADGFYFDSLAYSTAAAAGRDVITDFSQSQGDRIILGSIDADTKLAGNQDFHLVNQGAGNEGLGAFTKTAGELRYSLTSAGTLIQGDVNGDGKADFSILLYGNVILHAADFVL